MTAQTSTRVTTIGMIRDIFESATGKITSKHLPTIAEQTGFHPTTVRLQYYRWRAESKSAAARRARS
jgi:DNA-binding transcriptional regulator PaaX